MPDRARPTPRTVRRLTLASVVANAAIVVTGGAVRLTGSGLGCPTWPRCTDSTLTPTAAYAEHGIIEFSNRMLTFVLTAVVLATLVAVWRERPRRPGRRRLAALVFLGIPAQAVLGGVTVRTGLNPWTVMAHFLLSMVLMGLAVTLHWRVGGGNGGTRVTGPQPPPSAGPELRWLARGLLALTAGTLALGTVVTGSGPHSGDASTGRTGLDPAAMSQLHADAVLLLVGLTAGYVVALRVAGAGGAVRRAAAVLLAVELAQGLVGFVQYFTHLPVVLVGAHLAGACLVLVAACRVALASAPTPTEVPEPAARPALAGATA